MTRNDLMKEYKRLYFKSLQALEYGQVAELLGDQEAADEWYLTYELCNENMDVLNDEMAALDAA